MAQELPLVNWSVIRSNGSPVISGNDPDAVGYVCGNCGTSIVEGLDPDPDAEYEGTILRPGLIEDRDTPLRMGETRGFESRGDGIAIVCPNRGCLALNDVSDIFPNVER